MSRGAAKDSFAPPGLILERQDHGLRPWLCSVAAPRLNKDAAAPRYSLEPAKLFMRLPAAMVPCKLSRSSSTTSCKRKGPDPLLLPKFQNDFRDGIPKARY